MARKKIKDNINWTGLIYIVLASMVMGFLGMNLPNTISILNNDNILYGTWSSYVIICLVFYMLIQKVNLYKN